MTDTLKPTPGAQWRKAREEGISIPLPSGNVARLRPVALDSMITSGQIPDLLTPVAAKALYVDIKDEELGDAAELGKHMAELVNIVCVAAFVVPRIVDEPQADDEIALADVDFSDKIVVFNLAIAGVDALRKFRDGQGADVATVSDQQDDVPATELAGSAQRSLDGLSA